MRPLIAALNVDAMPWRPLGPAGLYSKLLSRDEETGARTALQRLVPAENYAAPTVAHYHHTYEEILGVQGLFSFDSKRWIRPSSYVFHPPGTVHGFKSAVIEESWFLSRVGRDLDVNLVPQPIADDIYSVDGTPPERAAVAMADPLAERGWAPYRWGSGTLPMEWCALSIHPATGEGTGFARFPAGWTTTLGPEVNRTYLEIFVLNGACAVDGQAYGRHFYGFFPPGEAPRDISSTAGATAYVNFGGPVGLAPATH